MNVDAVVDLVLTTVEAPYFYFMVFAVIVADAVFIVVPSETIVVALGALSLTAGQPTLVPLIVVSALGAFVGDTLTYWAARRLNVTKFAWARRPRAAAGFSWAASALSYRAVSVILTARFVPFGRLAVNLTAGSTRFPYRRFAVLTSFSAVAWSLYNVLMGAALGQLFGGNVILAVGASILLAVCVGMVVDGAVRRLTPARPGSTGSGHEQAALISDDHETGAVMGPEFSHHPADVGLGGVGRDDKLVRDLRV